MQETLFSLGNPMGPQASPVYMCTVPLIDDHRRNDPMTAPSRAPVVDERNQYQQQPLSPHQQQAQPQDTQTSYGSDELIDLDMLINTAADQHSYPPAEDRTAEHDSLEQPAVMMYSICTYSDASYCNRYDDLTLKYTYI